MTAAWSSTLRQGFSKRPGRSPHRVNSGWPHPATQLLLSGHSHFCSPIPVDYHLQHLFKKVKPVNSLYHSLTKMPTDWHSIFMLWSLPWPSIMTQPLAQNRFIVLNPVIIWLQVFSVGWGPLRIRNLILSLFLHFFAFSPIYKLSCQPWLGSSVG